MKRFLALAWLVALPSLCLAQSGATNGPNAVSPARASAPTAEQQANCPPRPPFDEGAPSRAIIELDPDTLWRPRGGEVRFTIRVGGTPVAVSKVRVCFGWASPDAAYGAEHTLLGSPGVRSVWNDSKIEYGAVVPRLSGLPLKLWWGARMIHPSRYEFTGVYAVPLADMVVEVTTADNQVVLTALPVGVTSVAVGWAVVAVIAAILWLGLREAARHVGVGGSGIVLRIISTRDGYASLSQLQILLWTLVVGMSAIYVMTLSGNLISISAGTLTLLGIASASALLARVPGTGPVRDASAPLAEPRWADLVIPDRRIAEVDVTRLQMLAFTMITAGFVVLKVVVDYEIPSIPENFLVLMGISNGVYVAGRSIDGKPAKDASADPKGRPAADPKTEQPVAAEKKDPPAARE
jgi:hypothetical protein